MGGISELKFFFTELGFKILARAMHQLSICNVDLTIGLNMLNEFLNLCTGGVNVNEAVTAL